MKKLYLEILTPYGKYFTGEVNSIHVHSASFFLGITPNHSPLVSSVIISKLSLNFDGVEKDYAIGRGVISVKNGKVKLLVSSIEAKEEIDIKRAEAAKKRAEERLTSKETWDVIRAQAALERALNRIKIYNNI